ncbi:MAG: hypothetical protein U1E85_08700 [Rhodocyclaceae bacterium]
MDARIFADESMGLRAELQTLPLDERLTYDATQNLFFVNFSNLEIRRPEQIDDIRRLIGEKLGKLDHKVLRDHQLRQFQHCAGVARRLRRNGA